jgi:hypothetical protein
VLTKTEETQEKHPNLKKKTEEISKVWWKTLSCIGKVDPVFNSSASEGLCQF